MYTYQIISYIFTRYTCLKVEKKLRSKYKKKNLKQKPNFYIFSIINKFLVLSQIIFNLIQSVVSY